MSSDHLVAEHAVWLPGRVPGLRHLQGVAQRPPLIAARADELHALRERSARWNRLSPATGTKPPGTNSPGEPAGTSRPTSTPGAPTPGSSSPCGRRFAGAATGVA